MNLNDEIFYGLLLAVGCFLLSMVLTPFYTHFAYKYKFWKKQKKTTVDGKSLPVMTKLHAHKFKHVFPTMAGLIGVVSVTAITWIFNLDRGQTWLPLVGFLGGALVGVIDDVINIFGSGRGAAGLRGPVKFFLISSGTSPNPYLGLETAGIALSIFFGVPTSLIGLGLIVTSILSYKKVKQPGLTAFGIITILILILGLIAILISPVLFGK